MRDDLPVDGRARPRTRRPQPRTEPARADASGRLAAVRARRRGRRTARLGRAGAPEARPAEPEAGLQAGQPEVGRTPHLLAAQPGRARQEHRQALDRLRRRVPDGLAPSQRSRLDGRAAAEPGGGLHRRARARPRLARPRSARRDRDRRRRLVALQPREVAEDEQGGDQAGAQAAGHVARAAGPHPQQGSWHGPRAHARERQEGRRHRDEPDPLRGRAAPTGRARTHRACSRRAPTCSPCASASSAREHDVAIVENPPLARQLYSDVEVGQEDADPDVRARRRGARLRLAHQPRTEYAWT